MDAARPALFTRGNHKTPAEVVPRRFLEAIDATPYETADSGRLRLAEDLLRPDNPLTRRVIVNRVWHHLFGSGLVTTPDNFGRMGSTPTHPELLDYLAVRFAPTESQGAETNLPPDFDWSLKRLIRFIVTSHTWQLSAQPAAQARQADPDNRWLSACPRQAPGGGSHSRRALVRFRSLGPHVVWRFGGG